MRNTQDKVVVNNDLLGRTFNVYDTDFQVTITEITYGPGPVVRCVVTSETVNMGSMTLLVPTHEVKKHINATPEGRTQAWIPT